ncbi:hypothetical protein GA0070562_2369 [Micromonospora tulbaghiae]|uniref:Uncharacterized protein n=1 Tax=Micromonospora tulbaghiae TaxID=479978 RepID=A0ABY0KI62_9ACTN|nr:hypothetical protein GA0070562_2369 [Micromonospora tulbaghiae]
MSFADNVVPPPGDAKRGQLLRALAGDAIRAGLERHFGVTPAFRNCHRSPRSVPARAGHRARAQAAQRSQVPKISRVCPTSVKPCCAATWSAHRSTAGPATSTARPQRRQTRWW